MTKSKCPDKDSNIIRSSLVYGQLTHQPVSTSIHRLIIKPSDSCVPVSRDTSASNSHRDYFQARPTSPPGNVSSQSCQLSSCYLVFSEESLTCSSAYESVNEMAPVSALTSAKEYAMSRDKCVIRFKDVKGLGVMLTRKNGSDDVGWFCYNDQVK